MRKIKGIVLSIILLTMFGSIISAEPNDSLINLETLQTDSPEVRQVNLLLDKAESFYTRSLKSLDEMDIWQSVQQLEEILQKYPDSVAAKDAYFLLGELLTGKIQTRDAQIGAIDAYRDYITRFGWAANAWEAQYSIALIQYLYLKDYPAAKESIENLYENYSASLMVTDDNMKTVKLLHARILHKTGDFGEEAKALDEIELIDYKMDFSYQAELIKGIKPNRVLKDGNDKFIFMGQFDQNYPVSTLLRNFRTAETNVTKKLSGLDRDFSLEIYVFTDPEFFFNTTDREGSFGSGADAQIFYLDGQEVEPLFAQVYSFLVNSQKSDLRVDLFEVGFVNALGNSSLNFDAAALELGISSENFTGENLLSDTEFVFVSEKEVVAGAFVNFLLTNYQSENFYRIFRLMEPSRESGIKLASSEGSEYKIDTGGLSPQTLMEGFQNVYGVSFDQVTSEFLREMANRRDALDRELDRFRAANPAEKVKIDQSSPESVLISYFKSIQTGDYDSFRKCTTGNVREMLDEAYELYKQKKILEKVERWKMAIPYMGVKIEVVGKESFTDEIAVFKVNLLKNGVVMEKRQLVALKEKGKWFISEN